MLIWVAPISAYFFNWDLAYIAKKYLLCIDPSQLWFLWMLFGVFAIVWSVREVMIEKPLAGWAISFVFYGIGIVGRHIVPNVFCIWTACQYVIFFYIGMRIRVKGEKMELLLTERIPCIGWLTVDFILFAGTLWIGEHSGTAIKLISLGLSLLLHIVGAVTAWRVLQTLAERVHWQNNKVFGQLAIYSMPMYLFHQQIIYFTISALNGKVNPWINAGVNFAVAMIGAYAISSFLMRWRITRFLIGEK